MQLPPLADVLASLERSELAFPHVHPRNNQILSRSVVRGGMEPSKAGVTPREDVNDRSSRASSSIKFANTLSSAAQPPSSPFPPFNRQLPPPVPSLSAAPASAPGSTQAPTDSRLSTGIRVGHLFQSLSQFDLTHNFFGPRELPSAAHLQQQRRFTTWRLCFNKLIDELLRAAEDRLVYLPSLPIKQNLQRLCSTLDTVIVPRLCILQPVPGNLEILKSGETINPSFMTPSGRSSILAEDYTQGIHLDISKLPKKLASLQGDLYFSYIFQNPPDGFFEGLGPEIRSEMNEPVVQARLMMYKAYYAIRDILDYDEAQADIVNMGTDDELELKARERLTQALEAMAKLNL